MKKTLNFLFLFFLILAILCAFSIVAIQIVSVVIGNGAIATWAESTLQAFVCIFCSLSAIVAFLMSYAFKWETED